MASGLLPCRIVIWVKHIVELITWCCIGVKETLLGPVPSLSLFGSYYMRDTVKSQAVPVSLPGL